MALRKGLPAKLAATDADDTRYDLAGLVLANGDGTPRGGILGPISTLVTGGSTMRGDVFPFTAAAVRDGGVVLLANDGVASVALAVAPVANSRIDVIYAKQNDSSSTVSSPDGNDNAVLAAVTGTAAASPVKPAVPAGAVEIATFLIPAGVTGTNNAGVVITQTAQYTAAQGGTVPFRTAALRNAWTNTAPGQLALVGQDRFRWDDVRGTWVLDQPYAIAAGAGTNNAVVTGGGDTVNQTITFPSGRFTQPPILSALVGNGRFTVSIVSVSATSAVIQFQNQSAISAQVGAYHWQALQMLAATAAG